MTVSSKDRQIDRQILSSSFNPLVSSTPDAVRDISLSIQQASKHKVPKSSRIPVTSDLQHSLWLQLQSNTEKENKLPVASGAVVHENTDSKTPSRRQKRAKKVAASSRVHSAVTTALKVDGEVALASQAQQQRGSNVTMPPTGPLLELGREEGLGIISRTQRNTTTLPPLTGIEQEKDSQYPLQQQQQQRVATPPPVKSLPHAHEILADQVRREVNWH